MNFRAHNSVHDREGLQMRAVGSHLPQYQGALSVDVKDLSGRKFADNLEVSTSFCERIVMFRRLYQMRRQNLSVPHALEHPSCLRASSPSSQSNCGQGGPLGGWLG